ncbi:MAG: 2,3-cyclic phosphodiesterase [Actinomycetia bacterium]|nr:2,3-cyclic phosphodiesterase [Actinomycetes bacterium]
MSDERPRLFCALQLPDETVRELTAWQASSLHTGNQRGARIAPPANLHVTLAFLGPRPAREVPAIVGALRAAAAAAGPIELRPVRYRETGSVGMIVLKDVTGAATVLAEDLTARLERLGTYRSERRPWLPHVTVLRFKKRAGLSPEVTNIRSIHVVRSALYRSLLGRGSAEYSGARYDALETVALGGR